MFRLIKFIIWLVGLAVIANFGLHYFGYAINWQYFNYLKQSNRECEAKIRQCKADFFAKGYENPDCQIKDCVQETVDNSKIIIKLK